MKLSKITLAVASLAAAPAFAATGSLNTLYGVTAANTVYMSGASALSGSLTAVIAANCTGGVANVKSLTIGGGTSDGRVTVCTTSSIDGQFAGPFAVVKRDTNGSFEGVGPVIAQTALTKWADVSNCDSTALNCALDSTTPIVPHAGLSDVDTNVWIGMNNTDSLSVPVPTNTASTTLTGGFAGQGFGVMASNNLYRAMQVKQVNEGRLPADCSNPAATALVPATLATVAAADPAYTPGKCQPSISKEEYAAVVDGNSYAYVANGALSGDSGVINLCRRVETSGTQASSNVYFLNNSCGNATPTKGFIKPKKAGDSGSVTVWDSAAGDSVTGRWDDFSGAFGLFEGSGTGDARNCVSRRNTGKNPNNVADSLGNYAIGWISLENATQSDWKYLKLDGVSPNAYQTFAGWVTDANQRVNVVRGYYDAAPELEMLYPTSSTYATFFNTLKKIFSTPSVLNTRGIFQANGATDKDGNTLTHAGNTTQVHKGTRNGNFCKPQTLAE